MSRKRQKAAKSKVVNYQVSDVPKNKLIEIHAEAYYRALKRIEEEKKKEKKINTPIKKEKWYVNLLFILNFLFFPFKIHKRFQLREQVYDSVLLLFVTLILKISGVFMWFSGIMYALFIILPGLTREISQQLLINLGWVLIIMLFGSLFYLAGKSFINERDSNKIHAYSASILALVSSIVSIITLINGGL